MKYKINENYGKRAYNELQEIKQDILQNSNTKNNQCYTSTLKYFFNNIYTNFTKSFNINSKKSLGFVKILYNNDKNYVSNNIKIIQNDSIVYNGEFYNNIILNLNYYNKNTFKIIIDCDNLDLEFSIEFIGPFECNENKILVENNNSNIYVAYDSIDETIVYKFENLSDVSNNNYIAMYNIPIKLLDIKNINNCDCFSGEVLLLIGVNSSKELVYYSSIDSFVTSIKLLDYSDIDYACCSSNSNYLITYYLTNNSIKYTLTDNSNLSTSYDLNITNSFSFSELLSCTNYTYNNVIYQCLLCKSNKNLIYLIIHNEYESTKIEPFIIFIGSYASADVYSDVSNIYINLNNEDSVKIKKVTLDIDNHKYTISDVATHSPCQYITHLGTNYIVQYSNCLTVKWC